MIQCNSDIRELSGHDNKSLISGFGLFCLGNTGSNFEPSKSYLISGSLISGLHYIIFLKTHFGHVIDYGMCTVQRDIVSHEYNFQKSLCNVVAKRILIRFNCCLSRSCSARYNGSDFVIFCFSKSLKQFWIPKVFVQSAGASLLHLYRGVRSPANECPGYNTKQSDREVQCWSFGECQVHLHCHRSQVNFCLKW